MSNAAKLSPETQDFLAGFSRLVLQLAEVLEKARALGGDAGQVLETARDAIAQKTGLTRLQSMNLVRIAMQVAADKHGNQAYTPEEMQIIVSNFIGE